MRNIRVNTKRLSSRKGASPQRRKRAVGDPAEMIYENFETINGWKPSLDLLDGENKEPENMSTNNAPDGISLSDDPNRPSKEDIARGANHEGLENPKPHTPPHENEKVQQSNTNINDSNPVTASEQQEDFKMRYRLAQKLAEIKVKSRILSEDDKDAFIDRMTDFSTTAQLEQILEENEEMYEQIKFASTNEKVANGPVIPNHRTGGPSNRNEMDPLSVILSGA